MKWGEYSNDVQFILQRSDSNNKVGHHSKIKPISNSNNNSQPSQNNFSSESPEKHKDHFKPLTFR